MAAGVLFKNIPDVIRRTKENQLLKKAGKPEILFTC